MTFMTHAGNRYHILMMKNVFIYSQDNQLPIFTMIQYTVLMEGILDGLRMVGLEICMVIVLFILKMQVVADQQNQQGMLSLQNLQKM